MTLNNDLVICREYQMELYYDCYSDQYVFSEVFEISLNENKTMWQIGIWQNKEKLYAYLHKIQSFSNDFSVKLTMHTKPMTNGQFIAKSYDGDFLNNDWIYLQDCKEMATGYFSLYFRIELSETSRKSDYQDFSFKYEELFNSKRLSDFTFICSDEMVIPAHSLILNISSPVLRAMLEAPMKESQTRVVNVDDIDGETMTEVLRFMYAGKVNGIERLGPKLYYCGEKYELNDLKKFCVASMIENLSVDNALEYFLLANRFEEKELLKFSALLIKFNYDKLRSNEDWEKLDFASSALIEVLTQSELNNIKDLKLFDDQGKKNLFANKPLFSIIKPCNI